MQKVTKRNIALAILFLLILVVVALLIGDFTYSFLGADISDDVKTQGETTASGDTIIFSKGNDLSLHATTDNFNATSGNLTDTTNLSVRLVASNKTNEATAIYYTGIVINENTFSCSNGTTAEVILTVRNEKGELITTSFEGSLNYVTVNDKDGNSISGFDITGKTGAFNIVAEYPISTTSSSLGTTHTWTFTITFVNHKYDQSINENATLNIKVILQNNYINYHELCDENILNCKVSKTVLQNGTGLIYHDNELINGAQDNSYRYSGANPNNYICFGSDADVCPEENLYRIIGIFDNKIKIIKANVYDSTKWNEENYNEWNNSKIKEFLNTNFYNSLDKKWQNLILESIWQVGGGNSTYLYNGNVQSAYLYEVGKNNLNIIDSFKIGLMYVSDYGYAADMQYWTTPMYNYGIAQNNNWLSLGLDEWTLSKGINTTDGIYGVINGGGLIGFLANDVKNVRPVFYLNSNIKYKNGDGSINNPYIINC